VVSGDKRKLLHFPCATGLMRMARSPNMVADSVEGGGIGHGGQWGKI
jgi:hypothetical protein